MNVFSLDKESTETGVFSFPASIPVYSESENLRNREKVLLPYLSGIPKEEVEAAVDSGLKGEVITAAEAASKAKEADKIEKVITEGAASGEAPEFTVAKLEEFMEDDPYLKAFISPATVNALRQSENPIVQRAARRKLANTAIALELIQAKREKAFEEGFWTNFDFVDAFVSDLPGVSFMNVEARKNMADRFNVLLNSSDDPAIVKSELQALLDEAADQGFFTQNNRFYLQDFLDLVTDGRYSTSAIIQETFALLDMAFAISALSDAARLVAATGKGKDTVKEVLEDAVKMDDPIAGHSVPSNFDESLTVPAGTRPTPRTPDESAAALDLNFELKASEDVIGIRKIAGQAIEPEAFEALKAEMVDKAKKAAEKSGMTRYVDADLEKDVFENVYLVETYGTTKGQAFASQVAAQKFADQLGGAEVVATGPKQWVVKKRSNVPTGEFPSGSTPSAIADEMRLYRASDPKEIGFGIAAKFFYSPLSQTDATRNAILKQGEAARAKAMEALDKEYLPLVSKVGNDGLQAINRVFNDIRDGSRAHLRQDLTIREFKEAFFELNKRMPTQTEQDLYALTVKRNIDDWYLTADMHLKREVNKGVEMFLIGELELAGVRASKSVASEGRMAWDIEKGKYTLVKDLDEEASLIRLTEPTEFGGKVHDLIATRTPKTRELRHTDVLGYNPGGSRLYEPNKVNFLLKQDRTVDMADGTTFNATPITIMAAKTDKEAAKALEELNGMIKDIHEAVSPAGIKMLNPFGHGLRITDDSAKTGYAFTRSEYLSAVMGKANDEALNAKIAAKSGWNTDIHSVKALVEFFEDMGLDLRKPVSKVEDGQPIISGDMLVGDLSFRDALSSPGTLRRANVRRDRTLKAYGGVGVPTVPPLEAMQRSRISSVARMTDVAYEASAINGLLKSLIKDGLISAKTLEEIRWLPLRQKLKHLDGKIPTKGKGAKYEMEREKILWRLEKRNFIDAAIQEKRDILGRMLHDMGWVKAGAKVDALSAEPIAAIRGITFEVVLGTFALPQLLVQSSHIISIMGTADKATGLAAAATLPVNRALIRNGYPAVTEKMAQAMGKFLNIKPEQYAEIIRSFRENGRNSVASSLADLGEDSSGRIWFQKFREKGRVFYNEGERLSRLTAHVTASLEYIRKFGPEVDLRTVSAQRWIANREDTLTFAMTSQSRAPIEQVPMVQFLSYTFRMAEFLTSGLVKDFKNLKAGGKWTDEFGPLSLKHKVKLLTTQMAFYGAAAIPGASYLLDKYNFENDPKINADLINLVDKGVIDFFIEQMTGIETELGRKLAWGQGLYTTLQDIGEESVLEIAAGPSYTVAKNALDSMAQLARNVALGQTTALPEDLMDVARTISSVNTYYNTWLAFQYGEFMTKNGTVIIDGLSPYEAAAIAFGVPLEDVNKVWRTREFLSKDRKDFMELGKIASSLYRDLAWEYEHKGFDTKRADDIRKAIEVFYAGFNPYDRSQIDKFVDKKAINLFEKTVIDVMKTPYNFEAN